MLLILIFLFLIFAYGLISKRLERTMLTAPIVFTAAGIVCSILLPEVRESMRSRGLLLIMAELGLVLLLFSDACRSNLLVLNKSRSLPLRLLGIGMPLTIVLGMAVAFLLFPSMPIAELGILAAILAPTDAGLGQTIVNSRQVPARIRQALNVEAGLNDGLSVPFLLFFMALVRSGMDGGQESFLTFLWEQLGLGVLIGLAIGWGGGKLLGIAERRGTLSVSWQPLAVVILPLLCLLVSKEFAASMFIAAFVAGLAVQVGYANASRHAVDFSESWGQILNLSVFYLFGLVVYATLPQLRIVHAAYALLSLTLIRMLPVALALIGTKLDRSTVLFMGWFGPRGLASIVLGLVYLEDELHSAWEQDLRIAVISTVTLSIFLHGASAAAGAKQYAQRVSALPSHAAEHESA